jgi:DNA mismatch repair protein MutS
VAELPNLLKETSFDAHLSTLVEATEYIQELIRTSFELELASLYWLHDIQGSFFRTGLYPELDVVQSEYDQSRHALQNLAEALSSRADTPGACKVETNDRYGYYLTLTKKRWDTVIQQTPPESYRWKDFKTTPISTSSSTLRITHPIIDDTSNRILSHQKKLSALSTECYKSFIDQHGDSVAIHLETISQWVADLDVHTTNARNANDFCYQMPQLSKDSHDTSYFTAKQLRHPIIERLIHVPYVPNDVSLGKEANGWLLYGINAAGKSSLMKAIGLNLIMAQAGMFVPCASLEYEPYESIFTRISGADNIYRGMSSFTVEMTELRNILLRSNSNSLVLGDELCAGTEALSALSIVAAGVETLAERRASFVFATHLHEVVEQTTLPSNVEVYHIRIELTEVDESTLTMTFDRHLTPGPGHPYYGLEVCRALALPPAFLRKAQQHRRRIQKIPDTFVHTKPSSYNKGVYVDQCALCQKPATETHHIHYQKDAHKKYVLHIPIHSAQNLIPLCSECHQKEHTGLIHIEGYKDTSLGRVVCVRTQPSQCLLNTSS